VRRGMPDGIGEAGILKVQSGGWVFVGGRGKPHGARYRLAEVRRDGEMPNVLS
jgi:hypothetical protein